MVVLVIKNTTAIITLATFLAIIGTIKLRIMTALIATTRAIRATRATSMPSDSNYLHLIAVV